MWRATSKLRPNFSGSSLSASETMMRCAVELTGRNSVRPCTRPRMMAASWSLTLDLSSHSADGRTGGPQRVVGLLLVAERVLQGLGDPTSVSGVQEPHRHR